ncbi:MAG: UDP-N-acetylmuramate dehydrogenase [Tannerella sp.]|jgi:UDP-N-acetylmuramate dehydrogenase|nr:UDP-N-acetylmuramate dehydrogenase [Tannerella sp.]
MVIKENYLLQSHNTFHIPARTRWFVEYDNVDELCRIISDEYFQECSSLHIGEGSNLLFINDFNGIILHSLIKGIDIAEDLQDDVIVRIGAGERWDDVVAWAVDAGYGGIENLSLIPGEAGAAAVQNIGAYGAEIKDVIFSVEAYNRLTGELQLFSQPDCCYGYRHSKFKNENDPYIVTYINIRLTKKPVFKLDYGNIISEMNGITPSLSSVRDAVIRIRQSKLPDPATLGNAGSFFINPVVDKSVYENLKSSYPDMPSYPIADDAANKIKIPAAWLIERCGFKGKQEGNAGVYDRQALIIVNHGGATGEEIAAFADKIIAAVNTRFGITIKPEVRSVASNTF